MKLRSSLLAKISLIVVLLISMAGVFTAYLVYNSSTTALKNSITSNLSNDTSQTMDKVDRFLYERLVDVQVVSGRQQLQTYLSQPASHTPEFSSLIIKQLNDFKVIAGAWSDVTLVNSDGSIALTTDEPKFANELSRQPDFKKTFAKALAGSPSYSDVILEGSSGSPVMLFMSPIRNTGAIGQPVTGVVVGELAWPAVIELLKGFNNIDATLINSSGTSLGDSQSDGQSDVLAADLSHSLVFENSRRQASGGGILPGLEDPGKSYLNAYTKDSGYLDYKGNKWVLVFQTPASAAFAPARTLAKKMIITFAIILVASVGAFIWLLNRQIIKPISDLREVVNRLSKGDFSLRTTNTSSDEIGELSTGFNNMADKVQFAYINLKESTEIAQNERNILRTLLNNLPVGVLVVSAPEGKPILMNAAGREISGRDAQTDIDSHGYTETYGVIKEDGQPYPTEELPLTITLKTEKTVMKDDLLLRRPDGTSVAVRAITTPIRDGDGQIRRAVSVFEDISKERNLERSREEFFSIASHELRTPLTAIRGNSDMIQQYYGDKLDDPDLKEMISDIHESANRLIVIVNDFLDTSRLEQKRMKFDYQSIDLLAVSESVIKEYQVTGSRQKIHLEIRPPAHSLPPVWADSNRVKQVLINLIGNAMKFTEQGSVTVSFEAQTNDIKVLVSDTGRGMSMEAQQLLFKKFEQTGSTVLTRDSVRGTGLGLYISKMIVEQMHGQIKLERSEIGHGTTFSFSLPLVGPDHKSDYSHPDILMGNIKG